jgi:hypothetical protein
MDISKDLRGARTEDLAQRHVEPRRGVLIDLSIVNGVSVALGRAVVQ